MNPNDLTALESTRLLSDYPAYRRAMMPPCSPLARKLKQLKALVVSVTPTMKDIPTDPLGHLQRSIPTILYGKAYRAISMDAVIDRTDPQEPVTQTFFSLREACRSIRDVSELRDAPESYADWSASQLEALGE